MMVCRRIFNRQLPSKLYQHAIGILGLRLDDVILTSFPRSGNTWVRFFFCNLISLQEWEGRTVDFRTLDNTMPEFGVDNLLHPWTHSTIPRIVKTHKQYLPFFRNKKVIMIMRDPRDVMVSSYYYFSGKKGYKPVGKFSEFIKHPKFGLQSWFRHHASWQPIDKEVFTYENLKKDDFGEFAHMLEYLELNLSQDIIQQAVERSRFKQVREIEEKYGHSRPEEHKLGFSFARKGITGDWKSHFSQADIAYYEKLVNRFVSSEFPYHS